MSNNIISTRLLWFFIILTAISALVMMPEIFTTIVFVTLGLGFVLIAAPNILIWVTLAIPLRRIGGTIALILVPVLLLVPGFLAQNSANIIIAKTKSVDFVHTLPRSPKKLRIIRDGFGYNISSLRCDEFCQSLFGNDSVSHLEYVNTSYDSRNRKILTRRITYSLKKSNSCETDLIFKGKIESSLLDIIANGKCITASKTMPADNVVTVHHKSEGFEKLKARNTSGSLFYRYKRVASVTIMDSKDEVIARRSDIILEALAMPFVIIPNEVSGGRIQVGPYRKLHKSIKTPVSEWIKTALYPGIKTAPKKARPRSIVERVSSKAAEQAVIVNEDYNRALKILDTKNSKIIENQQLLILEKALSSMRHSEELKSQQASFELRLLGDMRIQDEAFLTQRINQLVGIPYRKDKEAMPLLWERFKTAQKMGQSTDKIMFWIIRVDPQYTKPHAREILRTVSKMDAKTATGIFINLGKLGISPKEEFKRGITGALANEEHANRRTIFGICNSDPEWREDLAPLLKTFIHQAERKTVSPDNLAKAIKALELWEMDDHASPYRGRTNYKRSPSEFLKRYDKRPWDCR